MHDVDIYTICEIKKINRQYKWHVPLSLCSEVTHRKQAAEAEDRDTREGKGRV